ncbi:MAG TPA: galactokinase family protein [Verrucomicrobiae bacterium]|nr:galactokinase family protein [Verrucomicrobiae bacterium]
MSNDAQSLFKKHFGSPAVHLIRAPGRLELLGNHTDYNEGIVLSLAVDKYVHIAAAPRTDGKIELISTAFPKPEIFWADQIKKNPEAHWADYVKGVLDQLRKRGVNISGFNAAIDGTIPMGAGMSSSAALEVATALTVRQLFPYSLGETGIAKPPARDGRGHLPGLTRVERMETAKICRAAESDFVGVRVGLLDQISSLFGKAWHVMEIDFRSLTVEILPLTGEAIIVCNSGVKHALIEGTYNELRRLCESAAHKLGFETLRSVDPKMLAANRAKLTEREFECAHHVTSEIQRVIFASRALREDDHRQFGQYMFQSHESSRDFLKNSVPELDMLVELARAHPGCLGARLTGGGFGGATINLVAHHQAEDFMGAMARQYGERTGHKMQPILCQIVDGAA